MPTSSGVTLARPPAWPRQSTMAGFSRLIAASTAAGPRLNDTGIRSQTTAWPAMVAGSVLATSHEGFVRSPPKGSKPVTKIFSIRVTFSALQTPLPARSPRPTGRTGRATLTTPEAVYLQNGPAQHGAREPRGAVLCAGKNVVRLTCANCVRTRRHGRMLVQDSPS